MLYGTAVLIIELICIVIINNIVILPVKKKQNWMYLLTYLMPIIIMYQAGLWNKMATCSIILSMNLYYFSALSY